MSPKFPGVTITLTGEDGNAFFILGRVSREMKRAGIHAEFPAFQAEATAGDYDHLLATVMRWFEVV